MSKTKRYKKNATIPTKKIETYRWLEDTPWVASQEALDLTSWEDARSLITQNSSR